MFQEEIEALKAIYYQPGECTAHDRTVTIRLLLDSLANTSHRRDVNIIINVDEDYPNTIPEFSVISDDINRECIADLKLKVKEACKDFVGQPMLTALVTVIKDHIELIKSDMEMLTRESEEIKLDKDPITSDEASNSTALLHIDHMRSRTHYCKTLEKWTRDLDLKGRLLFYRRLILLILQGRSFSIKDFIVRLKTANIDVDARGHSCKEKMMSVMAEEPCRMSVISDYQVLELSDISDLEAVFIELGLQDMYKNSVSNMKG